MVARDPYNQLTTPIQGIAHNKASLDPYSYKYQDMLRPLKLTLRNNRFFTNATIAISRFCVDFQKRQHHAKQRLFYPLELSGRLLTWSFSGSGIIFYIFFIFLRFSYLKRGT